VVETEIADCVEPIPVEALMQAVEERGCLTGLCLVCARAPAGEPARRNDVDGQVSSPYPLPGVSFLCRWEPSSRFDTEQRLAWLVRSGRTGSAWVPGHGRDC
jgi:hypothetical protein